MATANALQSFPASKSTHAVVTAPRPRVVPRQNVRRQPRINRTHVAILTVLILALAYQVIMTRSQITTLHYEIQQIEYRTGKLETEKNAYYQHQAELSQLSSLKEAVANGAALDTSKVFRLAE